MKNNKGLLIALAAIGAVGGFAAFLFATKEGKKMTKSWKRKGEKIADEVMDMIDDAKEKFESLRKEFMKEDKKKEKSYDATNKAS